MPPLAARELNSGGMGEVVDLITPPPAPPTVGKFVKPNLASSTITQQRFENETHTALSLSGHPAFPLVEKIIRNATLAIQNARGEERQERVQSVIVMEKLSSYTLRDRVNNLGPLSQGEIAQIAAELALALNKMHSFGIVHRDLKHDNIVFEPSTGRVKILDFGLASDQKKPLEEVKGALIGSPSYMAPEAYFLIQNKCESDLFALGIIIWECLKTERMFKISDHDEWLRDHSKIPYLTTYLSYIDEIIYLSADRIDPESNKKVVEETIRRLQLTPEEIYSLWLTEDPEEIRTQLQKRLDQAKEKLAPLLNEYHLFSLTNLYGNIKKNAQEKPSGSIKFREVIKTKLDALNCDEELKEIITKLLDLDPNKRTKNEYVLARDLAKIAVKHDPDLRLVEPFYTLVGRCTSISNIEEPQRTKVEVEVEKITPPPTLRSRVKAFFRKIAKLIGIRSPQPTH